MKKKTTNKSIVKKPKKRRVKSTINSTVRQPKQQLKSSLYNHLKIEKKWQKIWDGSKIYEASDTGKASNAKKFYPLVEFPFPSGAGLHIGHIRSYTAMDIVARQHRMMGENVLYPIGWDAFGLPTENYAIKTGKQPKLVTKENTNNFRRQLKALGLSFDWSREINTTDPAYYKWTQWIFLQMFKKGLAYKTKMAINWCPKDKIGLANEEVVNGACERCGTLVEKREKEQWMLAITKYADRLDRDLDTVDYLEKIKIQQRNWIGRSEGVNFKCKVKDLGIKIEMYNSVPQSYHAETFTAIAPEHPLVYELVKGTPQEREIMDFVEKIKQKKAQNKFDIGADLEGIFTGRYIEKFADTGRDLPIWIASYVLADYGTGIVNCSAHDERDFIFAKKLNIPLRVVTVPSDETERVRVLNLEYCYAKDPKGIMLEPSQFKGRLWGEVRADVINHIVKNKLGTRTVNYKLRDWVFSRQRYWGEPIPLINCADCGWVAVPEKDLPVVLPAVKKYQPTDNGESPLATITKWVNTKCPNCKKPAKRETDTMPQWAGSSWYYLRYTDPKNKKAFASEANLKKWTPVDWYNGGMEHTTLHLLYSRFWHKFLYDIGTVETKEPYQKRTSHGLILAEGGAKMSKSKGNSVSPDELIQLYGADTLRVYEMFMGPFDQAITWNTENMIGSRRFIEKVWRLRQKVVGQSVVGKKSNTSSTNAAKISTATEQILHKTIKKVTEDIANLSPNTAISSLMILVNALETESVVDQNSFEILLKLLAPFAPHVAEELWTSLLVHPVWKNGVKIAKKKSRDSIHRSGWPTFDPQKLVGDTFKIAVQINGKLRTVIEAGSDEEKAVTAQALESADIKKHMENKPIIKVIYIKGRVINFVVKG